MRALSPVPVPFPCTPSLISFRQCSTCPDPTNCARLLEEKWRQAYNAVFRFGWCPSIPVFALQTPDTPPIPTPCLGPCQPSMVYRYLRNLEGVSPPLSLTHLACQTTAKAFTATRKRPVFFPLVSVSVSVLRVFPPRSLTTRD